MNDLKKPVKTTAAKAWVALGVGAIVSGLVAFQSAYSDGQMTSSEWVSVGIAAAGAIGAAYGVYWTPNRPLLPPR